jgi:hypothetical protein
MATGKLKTCPHGGNRTCRAELYGSRPGFRYQEVA